MSAPIKPPAPEWIVPAEPSVDDPCQLFELFRGHLATEILVCATTHLGVFERLSEGGKRFSALRRELQLPERSMHVLVTALLAMGALRRNASGDLELTDLSRNHLLRPSPYFVGDYFGLAQDSPGVREMVTRLKTGKPKGSEPEAQGVGFIYREGMKSAMETSDSARALTLALAGRAKNVAPALAQALPLKEARVVLDVGGGTGIYSIALLRANPELRAIVWDRPEVLRLAQEFAQASGVADRLSLVEGDMFRDPVPSDVDVVLLSNVLHDWDVAECRTLLRRCAGGIAPGSRVVIHDVFLNDALDGPLPVALYSAALFSVTEGRAYSVAEYSELLNEAGIRPVELLPTRIHCGALIGVRR